MEADRKRVEQARALRRRMTPPELRLWNALRREGVPGARFRRQHPIGPYVLDFYCDRAKLAVEVDGWGHNMGDKPRCDERRDAWLKAQGIRTLRFAAEDVRIRLGDVVATIAAAVSSPSGGSTREAGEGGSRS